MNRFEAMTNEELAELDVTQLSAPEQEQIKMVLRQRITNHEATLKQRPQKVSEAYSRRRRIQL